MLLQFWIYSCRRPKVLFLCYGTTWRWRSWAKIREFSPPQLLTKAVFPAARGAGSLPSLGTGTMCCDTSLTSEEPALAPHHPECPSLPLRQQFLPLQIFHAAAVVVPQPSSVKKIQLIWALLIVEVFGFLFQPGWFWQTVELSGQGNELHLDRWSFNSQCYYYFSGGAVIL